MDFEHTLRSLALQACVGAFMHEHVLAVEDLYYAQVRTSGYHTPEVLQALKARARSEGLWNHFLLGSAGSGLSNLKYAPVKEIMGRVLWAPGVFNCLAPDTGNMELLAHCGTSAQQAQWLAP